jgi:hypothetical protein
MRKENRRQNKQKLKKKRNGKSMEIKLKWAREETINRKVYCS